MAHGITQSRSGIFSKIFKRVVEKRLDKLAEQIADEFRLELSAHVRSGEAFNSIYIEKGDRTRFIGSNSDHFYFLDMGNKPRNGGVIKPKPPRKYLKFSDGTFHKQANPYEGIHFVKKVADRHR